MTSFKEPNLSYTEAMLRHEVHTDNSHWELMYKAMLAQLMTYVDAAVARALASHGIDGGGPERGVAPGRAASQNRGGAAAADAATHRHDAAMGGPSAGAQLPPWLQPFSVPEKVRFTRTPDALLRGERSVPPAQDPDRPVQTAAAEMGTGEDLPIWKKPVVLPANVRFNRTPYPKPFDFEAVTEDVDAVEAQTFTDEVSLPRAAPTDHGTVRGTGVVIALADVQAERALAAAAVSESDGHLPAWFDMMRAERPTALQPAGRQDDPGLEAASQDDLIQAWLEAHERIVSAKAPRQTEAHSPAEIPSSAEAAAPAAEAMAAVMTEAAPTLATDAAATSPGGGDASLQGEGQAERHLDPTDVASAVGSLPAVLALPAPAWLSVADVPAAAALAAGAPAAAATLAARAALAAAAALVAREAVGPYGDPSRWRETMSEPAAAVVPASDTAEPVQTIATEAGPYGDSSLWLTLIGAEQPGGTPGPILARAETAAAAEAAVAASARTATPVGIATPDDARAFAGPARAGNRRGMGAPHGPAPFEMAGRVTADPETYEDPPLDLLMLPPEPTGEVLSSGALEQNARLLEGVLEEFGIRGEIIDVRPGPVVTLYELEPAPGTKSSRVIGLADDIARSMSAVSARVAVVQGRNVIGIELPNQRRETVFLRELVGSSDFTGSKHKLAIALGKTIGGESVIVDLARMPHLLVAGTTGSGKSVAINTMILSILYQLRPEQCRLIMIDPKMLELSIYEGIPHLLTPVVTDPKKAVVALKWAVREMEDRYKKMSKVGVRNIDGFNARVAEAATTGEVITRTVQTGFNRDTGEPVFETEEMELSPLPYIVVVVDEMADLMMVAGKDIEGAIQRLAQMARAAGIHLIMATQRPSVDVITGTIKANFPTRISFQVTSKIDSRTILGEQGAEQLLGQGDMLYMAGGGRISRVHGPFVSDGEVEKVVAHLKAQGHPAYLDVVVAEEGADDGKAEAADDKPVFDKSAMGSGGDEDTELYDQAVKVVLRDKKCSTSYIQRRLQVGYNKAASLVERMEKEGIVGQANNAGKREILVYSRDLRFTESREGEE
jgi:S-DNA-T family DNA segregation ATPase FtsK/SpoIIIE